MRHRQHALLLLSLLAGAVLLHGASLWTAEPLVDEAIYEAAISRLAGGTSPYTDQFFYPPTFARAGVALRAAFGLEGTRYLMRAANLVGLIYILWFTIVVAIRTADPAAGRTADLGTTPTGRTVPPPSPQTPPTWLLILLPGGLLLTPGVRLGLATGNLSFLVGAAALFGFWQADRRPFLSGPLLGATLLIKPLIAGALPLLLLPGPDTSRSLTARVSRPRVTAAVLATGLAGTLLWFDRHELRAMLATELGSMPKGRSLSIYRFARELGLGEFHPALFALVTIQLCAVLWGRLSGRRNLLVGVTLAVPLTTLVVWSHTLVMCFPLASLAVGRMIARRRGEGLGWILRSDPRPRIEAVLVLGSTALLVFAHPGGFGDQPGWIQASLLAPFLIAPIALAAYWFRSKPA